MLYSGKGWFLPDCFLLSIKRTCPALPGMDSYPPPSPLWPLVCSTWQPQVPRTQKCHSQWWTLPSYSPMGAQGTLHLWPQSDLKGRLCSWLLGGISSEMGAVLSAGTSWSLLCSIIQEQLLTESRKGNRSPQPCWRLYNVPVLVLSFWAQNQPDWHLNLWAAWTTLLRKEKTGSLEPYPKRRK